MIAAELAGALGGDLGFETVEDDRGRHAVSPLDGRRGDGTVVAGRPRQRVGARTATPTFRCPPLDAYSLRLVAGRMLYDNGAAVARVAVAGALDQARRHARQPARPRPPRRHHRRARCASAAPTPASSSTSQADAGVPAGSAWLPVNVAVDDARALIDSSGPVTDIRIENV